MADDEIREHTGHRARVVELADVRVARGITTAKTCDHKKLVYDSSHREIYCEKCGKQIEHFDAFMVLVDNFLDMNASVQRRLANAKEAESAHVHMKAAKNISDAWRGPNKYAVACPHCRGGILPEDFANGPGIVSRELELKRRQKTKED